MDRKISIRLPERLLREIDRRARLRKQSRSDIIREALLAFTQWPEGTAERRPIDRVRLWIGSIKDLPPDLASNAEKYMKGFGAGRAKPTPLRRR